MISSHQIGVGSSYGIYSALSYPVPYAQFQTFLSIPGIAFIHLQTLFMPSFANLIALTAQCSCPATAICEIKTVAIIP
jgi:hypothetical protein